jgi:hypothetical protein
VKFWNPPGDRFAYGRVTPSFLPPEEGGLDRSDPSGRLHTQYILSFVPPSLANLPAGLQPQPFDRLRNLIVAQYANAFLTTPSPRERIQRGQFQDAARDLTDKQQVFARGLERLRTEAPGEVAEFVKGVNEAYEALRQAQYPDPFQRQPLPDSDPRVAEARGRVDQFWRLNLATAQLIVDRAVATAGRGEASFLLALAKHEEAERAQLRADRATGADAPRARAAAAAAWGEAANAWDAHLEQSGALKDFPVRTAHARLLADRARKLAAAK